MRCSILAAIGGLLIAAPTAYAQTNVPVNSRVRVELRNGQHVTGRLTDVRADTLVVIDDGLVWDSNHRIPADRMRRIDVSRGKYVHAGRVVGGALLGAVAGFIGGLVTATSECDGDVCGYGSTFPAAIAIGIAGGVTLGVLTPADRWEAVPSPVRVGVAGDGRHARLGLSFAF
jgi:hypothetical protein